MKKKWFAIEIILLFLGTCILPTIAQNTEKSKSSRGSWLYVGGSGPGNYTRIQDAIDNASDGDTVFVYDDASPYLEKIEVNTSISLLGEHRNNTVIDGGEHNYDTICISADQLHIEGFTIHGGIDIEANFTMICNNSIECGPWNCISIGHLGYSPPFFNNTIIDNSISGFDGKYINYGIVNTNSHFSRISRNMISMDGSDIDSDAIVIGMSTQCIISENILTASNIGILFYCSDNNSVYGNTISGNAFGMYIWGEPSWDICGFNTINLNMITSNRYGIFLDNASSNIIKKNNFLHNFLPAFFYSFSSKNQWMRNYWNKPKLFPKILFGKIQQDAQWHLWINIDWRPALKPYDIP